MSKRIRSLNLGVFVVGEASGAFYGDTKVEFKSQNGEKLIVIQQILDGVFTAD